MTTQMKPILFNTDMVRAILEGRKTVTRRVVRPKPPGDFPYCQNAHDGSCWWWNDRGGDDDMMRWWPSYDNGLKPLHRPGDILYVRETWAKYKELESARTVWLYKADAPKKIIYEEDGMTRSEDQNIMWRPSIHMPREAARIFLRVTDVRVERLQDIKEDGAFAEGVQTTATFQNPRHVFRDIWESTIKFADRTLYGWETNPYVWVIAFERCKRPEGG